jgi:hypothetical protein
MLIQEELVSTNRISYARFDPIARESQCYPPDLVIVVVPPHPLENADLVVAASSRHRW